MSPVECFPWLHQGQARVALEQAASSDVELHHGEIGAETVMRSAAEGQVRALAAGGVVGRRA